MQAVNLGANSFIAQNRVFTSSSRFNSKTTSTCLIRTGRFNNFGLRLQSSHVGFEIGSVGNGSVFRSSAKSRSVKAQSSGLFLLNLCPLVTSFVEFVHIV